MPDKYRLLPFTFYGQNFLDIQDRNSYSFLSRETYYQKEADVKK
jgi:hypothetical protein